MNQFSNYFLSIGGWSWLILGGLLLAIEVLAPGVFMLWLGLAAMITGVLTLLFSLGPQAQLIVFSIASLASVFIGRKFFAGNNNPTDQPLLNERGDQLIGKTFTVIKAIEHGSGKIKIGDTVWSANGPDAKIGTQVNVVSVDGNRLSVELVKDKP